MSAGGEQEPADDVVFDEEKTQKVKEKKESERAQKEADLAQSRTRRAEQRSAALEKAAEEEFLRLNKRTWNQVRAALEYLGRPTVYHTSPAPAVAATVLKEGIAWYRKVMLATHPDKEKVSQLADKFPDEDQRNRVCEAGETLNSAQKNGWLSEMDGRWKPNGGRMPPRPAFIDLLLAFSQEK